MTATDRPMDAEREGTAPLVLLDRHESVAIVRLNRPQKRNAVNEQMSVEARSLLDALEADDTVRVIILTGAGDRAFCAGQDMAEASGRVERPDGVQGGGAGGLAQRLATCEKPVIGAINGFCFGGGMSVALACDFRLASETATFRLPGANYGLVVAATMLTSAVGPGMAKELILTARVFDAAEAKAMGLVNHVVPPSDLEPLALEYGRLIAANSPLAVRHSKRIVNIAAISAAAQQAEADVNRQLRGGDDHTARFNRAADRVLKSRA